MIKKVIQSRVNCFWTPSKCMLSHYHWRDSPQFNSSHVKVIFVGQFRDFIPARKHVSVFEYSPTLFSLPSSEESAIITALDSSLWKRYQLFSVPLQTLQYPLCPHPNSWICHLIDNFLHISLFLHFLKAFRISCSYNFRPQGPPPSKQYLIIELKLSSKLTLYQRYKLTFLKVLQCDITWSWSFRTFSNENFYVFFSFKKKKIEMTY